MTDTGWIAGALVLGIVIGALVVWLMNRKAAGPSHSVKALRQESEKFREEVNDHFVETAELINNMTDSYKKVFDHLSEGAERLVDEKVLRERMPEVSDQEIRLKRIGQTSSRPQSPEVKPEDVKKPVPGAVPDPENRGEAEPQSEPEAKAETEQPQEKLEKQEKQETPEAQKATDGQPDTPVQAAEKRDKAADETAASSDQDDPASESKEKSGEQSSVNSPKESSDQTKKTD